MVVRVRDDCGVREGGHGDGREDWELERSVRVRNLNGDVRGGSERGVGRNVRDGGEEWDEKDKDGQRYKI